jgi:hypothetical protein
VFFTDAGARRRACVASAGESGGDAIRQDDAEVGVAAGVPLVKALAPGLAAFNRAAEELVMRSCTDGRDGGLPCAR